MGRRERIVKRPFVLFCEGDTEYNYFNGLRSSQQLDITIKTINMHGGGYKHFLDTVKKNNVSNRIATFIIIDADRTQNNPSEFEALKKLAEYCKRQNSMKGEPPYFLIVNCPDFEYLACLHDKNFSSGDTAQHIKTKFKEKTLDDFKKRKDVYDFLNSNSRHYTNMLEQLKNKPKWISNEFKCYDKKSLIFSAETTYEQQKTPKKGSNIEEFFGVVFHKSI